MHTHVAIEFCNYDEEKQGRLHVCQPLLTLWLCSYIRKSCNTALSRMTQATHDLLTK